MLISREQIGWKVEMTIRLNEYVMSLTKYGKSECDGL